MLPGLGTLTRAFSAPLLGTGQLAVPRPRTALNCPRLGDTLHMNNGAGLGASGPVIGRSGCCGCRAHERGQPGAAGRVTTAAEELKSVRGAPPSSLVWQNNLSEKSILWLVVAGKREKCVSEAQVPAPDKCRLTVAKQAYPGRSRCKVVALDLVLTRLLSPKGTRLNPGLLALPSLRQHLAWPAPKEIPFI